MFVCFRSYFPSAWSSLQKSFLYQKRFIHFFECTHFFSYGCRDRCNTNRTSFEFFNDGRKNFIVHIIQTILIYIQGNQRKLGDGYGNGTISFYLSKVARSP